MLDWLNSYSNAITAASAVSMVAITGVYALFTILLWRATRRQAQTATLQAQTTQRMLDLAHRPWLSIELCPDAGTGPDVVNYVSILHNHGTIPATVIAASSRASYGEETLAEGKQLQPKQVPAQLCIFPDEDGELVWGFPAFLPRTESGFFRIRVEITYRGAFDTTYTTRVEASYPRPETNLSQRSDTPMQVVRVEAT